MGCRFVDARRVAGFTARDCGVGPRPLPHCCLTAGLVAPLHSDEHSSRNERAYEHVRDAPVRRGAQLLRGIG